VRRDGVVVQERCLKEVEVVEELFSKAVGEEVLKEESKQNRCFL
jgi:hypothetical protein